MRSSTTAPVVAALLSLLLIPAALGREGDDTGDRDKPEQTDQAKEQQRWENLIQFFGEEDTGAWSLRIQDKNVREHAQFRFVGLWSYDRKEKKWKRTGEPASSYKIVPKGEKGPQEPENEQVLVELTTIKPGTVGLFYG